VQIFGSQDWRRKPGRVRCRGAPRRGPIYRGRAPPPAPPPPAPPRRRAPRAPRSPAPRECICDDRDSGRSSQSFKRAQERAQRPFAAWLFEIAKPKRLVRESRDPLWLPTERPRVHCAPTLMLHSTLPLCCQPHPQRPPHDPPQSSTSARLSADNRRWDQVDLSPTISCVVNRAAQMRQPNLDANHRGGCCSSGDPQGRTELVHQELPWMDIRSARWPRFAARMGGR